MQSESVRKQVLLIVEDNPLLTNLYKAAFEKEGVEVLVAHDGETGFTLIKEKRPHLVVLDILMPGIDGFEVLARVKNDPEIAHIKVVMLTVISEQEAQERARKLGVVDYLIKSELMVQEIVDRVLKHFT